MINRIGLFAAAISTFIAYFILTIYRYFDVRKYLKIKFEYKTLFSTTVVFIIITILYYLNNLYANIVNILISVICCAILNKDIIKIFLERLGMKK